MKASLTLAIFLSLISTTNAGDKKLLEAADKGGGNSSNSPNHLTERLAASDSLQGVEGQLRGLYAQRNSILKGLHDLGYDVCMGSRIGSVDKLIQHLSEKPRRKNQKRFSSQVSVVWDCPPNAKCEPPSIAENSRSVVLPILNQPHAYKTEFKKTQVVERLLKFEERRDQSSSDRKKLREQGKKIGFHRNFFHRNSCLAGAGIERGCRLLSGDKNFKDPQMKRLAALMEKNPEFKLRFNKELACDVSDSKKNYIESLKPVQELIVEFENKLKKARKGIDDDGRLVCEENDQGQEVCRLAYDEPTGEVCETNDNGARECYMVDDRNPPIANHPVDDPPIANQPAEEPPVANHPRQPASADLTCRKAVGLDVEYCFDKEQKRYRCTWDNGQRYCEPN